jgi:hypothetical protein
MYARVFNSPAPTRSTPARPKFDRRAPELTYASAMAPNVLGTGCTSTSAPDPAGGARTSLLDNAWPHAAEKVTTTMMSTRRFKVQRKRSTEPQRDQQVEVARLV